MTKKRIFKVKDLTQLTKDLKELNNALNTKDKDDIPCIEEPQCNCHMTNDFTCPHCGGNMIDVMGHYVCPDCEFID